MSKILSWLDKTEEIFTSITIIFVSCLICVQVLLRYAFNYSIFWSEEVAKYLIVWFIFVGSSITARDNAHVRVDVLWAFLPKYPKIVLNIFADLIAVAFFVIMIYAGLLIVSNAYAFNSKSASMELPLIFPYLAIPVGMFLIMLSYLRNIYKNIVTLKNAEVAK